MFAAERGADYVMFGEPDADGKRPAFPAIEERVALVGGSIRNPVRRLCRLARRDRDLWWQPAPISLRSAIFFGGTHTQLRRRSTKPAAISACRSRRHERDVMRSHRAGAICSRCVRRAGRCTGHEKRSHRRRRAGCDAALTRISRTSTSPMAPFSAASISPHSTRQPSARSRTIRPP